MMKKKYVVGLATGVFIFIVTAIANASILTFDGLAGYDYVPIDQNYGDSVTATSDLYGQYLEGNGFTPNVNAEMGSRWGQVFA